ncbi:MAG: D-glycero-alpha-D-manno-heptose-7-phosphate kinase, partial [Chloroflexota bacterium]|nr:D-glycero-alpha-D-manno-heptose-7-phosphate kinase [Chloroflexota bacterium]
IVRAPVRISFAGGGTDLEAYYREHGGLVVSTTIDKYFYVLVNRNGMDSVQISSSDYHTFFRQRRGAPMLWGGDLSLPRAFLHEFGIDSGISLFLASEIPPGTGLGSSSTVSVALGKALSTLGGQRLSPGELAELASRVEIEKLEMPIGRQDQYAAAFGGLNVMHFSRNGVDVEPLGLQPQVERALERHMMLFFTGVARSASNILKNQQAATEQHDNDTMSSLHRLKAMAQRTIQLLRDGDLAAYGELLDESWQAKKRLAPHISNARIDGWYEVARQHGATGGKITGAGGGGFLMLYCDEPYQESVTGALEDLGLVRMDFHFEHDGAVVLMDALPRIHQFDQRTPQLAGIAYG